MRTRILYTEGKGSFTETGWDRPDCGDNEIAVTAIMTGICRSDIDMMEGNFGPLPINMSGHEGLGLVTKIGANITDVAVGDYVATRGEPAYADHYLSRQHEYVKVPAAEPKYILEPVACGMNIVISNIDAIEDREGPGKKLLILGSGFLAWVAYNTLLNQGHVFEIDVVGSSNRSLWGDALSQEVSGMYDVIIDLSSRTDIFDKVIYNEDALIIMGSQKTVTTDFSAMLWKAVTMTFPSPRNSSFQYCMSLAAQWIEEGAIKVDSFWTKAYNRNTEWQQAFEDGANRPSGYNRGYLIWRQDAI